MPVSSTSHSSTRMRALPRWSASSLTKTMPAPVKGEPLRRAMVALEVVAIDGVEAGFDADQTTQRHPGRNHGAGDRRAHVAVGQHAHRAVASRHLAHAGQRAEHGGNVGLAFDVELEDEDAA